MPHKLKNIAIKEISFVTKGASGDSKHAPRVIFWKGNQMPSFVDRLKGIFSKAEGEGTRTPEQMLSDLMQQLSPEQQDVLTLILAAAKAAPPDSGSEPMAKPQPAEPEKQEGEEDMPEEMQKMLDDNPKLAEHLAKVAAARKADREEIEKLRRDNEARKEREALEVFRKQVEEYAWLPGDHDKVAVMLKEVDEKLTGDSQQTLADLIRMTDGIVRKSSGRLFGENGSSRPGDSSNIGDGQALAKLEAAAEAFAKKAKEAGKPVTIERARVEVLKSNRELRTAVNLERM